MTWTEFMVSGVGEPGGRIVLRRDPDGVYVDRADPVMWFAQHALNTIEPETEESVGWTFDGSLVTLIATNGRWVWKLTGRSRCHEYGPGTEPLVMLEGVWPD